MSLLDKIIFNPLDDNQYFRKEISKTQIYLHHTSGGPSAKNTIAGWNKDVARIGTAFVIDNEGEIYQAFSSKYWAYHLGLDAKALAAGGTKKKTNEYLNQTSIGIELCNWGWLTKQNGQYVNYVNKPIDAKEVITLDAPYRGYLYWHNYTDAQIASLKELLIFLGEKYNIPLAYKGNRIFDICPEALQGEPGLWTHSSVRKDKFDCYPHLRLIETLQTL